MKPAQPNSPFKFLDSYQNTDRDIFFGRERETAALYHALSGVKHLLIYGPSGAGKTSLVECGLRNQFSDADWLALTIRKGDNISASVFAAINQALEEKIELDPHTLLPSDPELHFGKVIEDLFSERFQTVYLLFDQFEELLISGTEQEQQDFFIRLHQLIRHRVPCRMLLIIREEFVGHLSEFESLCPSIFQHRFRLEKMRRGDVGEVIRKTLEAPQFASSFTAPEGELLAETILSKLPDERREIELAHVQVFLAELWDRANLSRQGDHLPLLQPELIQPHDNLESVLDRFLKKQLDDLDLVYGEKMTLEVLSLLISERHTKIQVTATGIAEELIRKSLTLHKPLTQLLNDLQQRRILRTLKAGDLTQYEMSHDVLAHVVGENLTEEMKLREKAADIYQVYGERKGHFSQEDLDYLRPFGTYLAFPADLTARMRDSEQVITQRQQADLLRARGQLRRVVALLGAAVLALLVAGYFWWQANEKTVEAELARVEAVHAQARTDSALVISRKNLLSALKEKQGRIEVELGNHQRSLAIFEKADHEGALFQTRHRIDSLEKEKLMVENEIQNVL